MLINTELKKGNYDYNNRATLKAISNQLISSDKRSFLSNDGQEILDKYSQRGFEILLENDVPNNDVYSFLTRYYENMQNKKQRDIEVIFI